MADTTWISETLEDERRHGRRYGYDAGQLVVANIVNELHEQGDPEIARLIHDKVWRRLEAERAKWTD